MTTTATALTETEKASRSAAGFSPPGASQTRSVAKHTSAVRPGSAAGRGPRLPVPLRRGVPPGEREGVIAYSLRPAEYGSAIRTTARTRRRPAGVRPASTASP